MHPALKWSLRILGGLVGLIVLLVGVIYIWSEIKLGETFDVTSESIPVDSDSASLVNGEYLATAIGKCYDCHGGNFGGKLMFDEPIIGTLSASNLTTGEASVVKDFKPEDWVRAVRYGVKADGHAIPIMPSHEYWNFSDEELGDIIAYITSLPPVDGTPVEQHYGPMGRMLFVTGQLPLFAAGRIDRTAKRLPPPSRGATVEYGEHLTKIGGCAGCHGKDFSGGPIPGHPPGFLPGANLTPHADGLGNYTEEDFFTALRQGRKKDGSMMDGEQMPWNATALMTDEDTRAIWLYLRSISPVASTWKES